jgi:4-hydroxy-tetrahydrodipicolinate reductase
MRIGLIGYGKIGREIEKIALGRGHEIPLIIDIDNRAELTVENLRKCDVVIEFTTPASAVSNYLVCFEAGVPVVSGTTGWLSEREMVNEKCRQMNGTFFYASNFSIGVNIFFELNRRLAGLMLPHPGYDVSISEIHHVHKLDSPSGTAIKLAEDLIDIVPGKKGWRNAPATEIDEIAIVSERRGEVPGTHAITWESNEDRIGITHIAKNRTGFALGAVLAAEFCPGHTGILGMKDMLQI